MESRGRRAGKGYRRQAYGDVKVIVLASGVFDKGGIARYLRYQIRALREAYGAESVQVLSLLGPSANDFEDPIEVRWSGSTPTTDLARARFAIAALNETRRFRPDVVIGGHVNFGSLAVLSARLGGAKAALNLYGAEVWSRLPPLRRLGLRAADLVVATCHNTESEARRLGVLRGPVRTIWDCTDLSVYCPGVADQDVLARYGVPKTGRFRILFLSRLNADTRYKGSERVLEVLKLLPPDRFEVVFAGSGDDCRHLQSVADSLRVGSFVSFTGSIRESDMPDLYRSADAFYLTSMVGNGEGEGIPLTPIEALGCGVPIIVGNADGSRELLYNGGGVCTDPNDLDSQARYLLKLQSDPATALAERKHARARAEQAFGFEAFKDKTLQALTNIACPRTRL